MGLTAKDIIDLPILKNSQVKAGRHLLDRTPVEWVSVIEGPVENFIRKNELVLTTGIGCEENPRALEKFVEDIIKSGASMLAMATGRFIFNIPDPVLQLADRHDFIIIEVPWEVRFGDIMQNVLQKINKNKVSERQRAEAVRKELINCVLQDKPIQNITKSIYKYIDIPVAVLGESFQVRAEKGFDSGLLAAFTEGIKKQETGLTAASTFFTEHPLYYLMREFRIREKSVFQLSVQNNNKQQGLILFQPKRKEELNWFVMTVLEHALTALALFFAKENAVEMTEIRLRDNFILGLAKEHKELNSQVLSKAELLDYNLNLPYVCMVGTVSFNGNPVALANDNPATSSMQSLNYYLQKEISNAGKQLKRKTLTTFDEGEVIVYIEAAEESFNKVVDQYLDVMERRLTTFLSDIKLSWGIARHEDGFYAFYQSYEKARTALDIGLKQKGSGERTFFSDTRINRLLMSLSKDEGITEIVTSTLQPLLDYDKKRQTDLLYTFMVYNKYKGNVSQAARELNLHRQSLLHRLRNIEALTNLSLVESDDSFLLELSVRLWMLNKID